LKSGGKNDRRGINFVAFATVIDYGGSMKLKRLNWSKRNHAALNEFLARVRPGETAVFDWDNTCIFGDIGDAVFRHQALHLEFKFGPDRLREIIPGRVHGIDHVRINGRSLPLRRVKEQIVRAYHKIAGRPLAEIGSGDAYRDFSAGLLALNRGLEQTPGIGCEFAYLWTVNFLEGFRPAEVRRLAAAVARQELQSPLQEQAWSDSGRQFLYRWTAGIRPFPEMADLSLVLKKAGCRVLVSTASNPLIVETMIANTGFAADRVLGQASGMARGRLLGTLAPGLRSNFGSGKVENLRRALDRDPVFTAGDSPGDYEMLTAFPATRLKLLIRRPRPGKMATLYRQALNGDPNFLLQDIDHGLGMFLP
jgi:phosphoserine phosphatase